jgi:hypothetical protein
MRRMSPVRVLYDGPSYGVLVLCDNPSYGGNASDDVPDVEDGAVGYLAVEE